jgi:hypothetical protein
MTSSNKHLETKTNIVRVKVVKITSQHVYNVSNRVQTRNRSNSVKIGQTRKIGPILPILTEFD